jgi:hypothetical protein
MCFGFLCCNTMNWLSPFCVRNWCFLASALFAGMACRRVIAICHWERAHTLLKWCLLLPPCSTDLLALPTCDPDKSFAVQIGHEETMVNGPVAYVQCALLHTSSNGERRIR